MADGAAKCFECLPSSLLLACSLGISKVGRVGGCCCSQVQPVWLWQAGCASATTTVDGDQTVVRPLRDGAETKQGRLASLPAGKKCGCGI